MDVGPVSLVYYSVCAVPGASAGLLVGLGSHRSPIDGIRVPLHDGRKRRVAKTLMEREDPGWWVIEYNNGGGSLPNNQLRRILNLLIDNGFDVEVSFVTLGKMWGITDVWFGASSVFISQMR